MYSGARNWRSRRNIEPRIKIEILVFSQTGAVYHT